MVRFRRLAVLICAAAIAAAPGSAKNGVWRTGTAAHAAVAATEVPACAEAASLPREAAATAKRPRAAASFAPQRSQAELRNAAAAQIAKMWARG